MLSRVLESAHPFLQFGDLVRCRLAGAGPDDPLFRRRRRRHLRSVAAGARVRYGQCAVHGCGLERLLCLTVTDDGVRQLSWFPYCGLHKRLHQH